MPMILSLFDCRLFILVMVGIHVLTTNQGVGTTNMADRKWAEVMGAVHSQERVRQVLCFVVCQLSVVSRSYTPQQ